ncbi:MAG TPA: hypothetical protein PK185_15295 [Cyclobacteriaceae bacterium]|nr:hypothetical protein [Cyclobacteriaceae bacterium]
MEAHSAYIGVVRNMKKMATRKKILVIVSSIIVVLIVGGLFIVNQFFSAFAPPKIEITTEYISTNRDFINGLTIEKIQVDSMGQNGIPAKYTVFYWTSCSIDHPEGRPPEPPDKIYFDKKGEYWWTEENVDLKYIHKGLRRESLDNNNRIQVSMGDKKFSTCPMEFQREQWYFIRTYDPAVTGIFFFIDKDGAEHQYDLASGVSPI